MTLPEQGPVTRRHLAREDEDHSCVLTRVWKGTQGVGGKRDAGNGNGSKQPLGKGLCEPVVWSACVPTAEGHRPQCMCSKLHKETSNSNTLLL